MLYTKWLSNKNWNAHKTFIQFVHHFHILIYNNNTFYYLTISIFSWMSIILILTLSVEGDTRIVRQCGHDYGTRKPNTCVDRTGTHKIKIKYCICTGEACNSASSLSTSIILMTSMSVVVMAIAKFIRLWESCSISNYILLFRYVWIHTRKPNNLTLVANKWYLLTRVSFYE